MAGLREPAATEVRGDGLLATLDPGWNIWGPAGGYIAAIALSAVRHQADSDHRPVSMTGQFVRVAKPGQLEVAVAPVKTGGSALFAVTLSQEGQDVFLAQVWTTSRNDASLPLAPAPPKVPTPDKLRDMAEEMVERGQQPIAFWQNLEGRPANFRVADDAPAHDPHQLRWMRFRDWEQTEDPFLNAMRYVLLIDIGIWPAHWHRQSERGGYLAPSLDVWAHFHGGAAAGEWLLSDADADVSGNGTLSGRVRIWSGDGRAVATGGGACLVMTPKPRPS